METVSRWKWFKKRVLKDLSLNTQRGDVCVISYVLLGAMAEAYPQEPSKKNFCGFFPRPRKGMIYNRDAGGNVKKGRK